MNNNGIGSRIAKSGFANEDFVCQEFDNWQASHLSQAWLQALGYKLHQLQSVTTTRISGTYKTDIQIQIIMNNQSLRLPNTHNIQVKLVSSKASYNQIDKRWLSKYKELWNIPDDVFTMLQYYTGELTPTIAQPRDPRRMYFNEFSPIEQSQLLGFFNANKFLIVADILRGRDPLSADWMLVIQRYNLQVHKWILKPMEDIISSVNQAEILITKQGNLRIGPITMQRKGGDGGKPTANMLQFKINALSLWSSHELS